MRTSEPFGVTTTGLHPGVFAVDLLVDIRDGLARVLLDLAHVRVGDEAAEETDELLLLDRRDGRPRAGPSERWDISSKSKRVSVILRISARRSAVETVLTAEPSGWLKTCCTADLHRFRRTCGRRGARRCQQHCHDDLQHRAIVSLEVVSPP